MRLEFEVELPDAPGELSRVLRTVADHGGNVQAVLHRHEKAVSGRVPVAVAVEVVDADAVRLLDALARHHRLLRVNREGGPARAAVLLVGHVFESDLRSLLDTAFEHRAAVDRVDARVSARADPSAVLVSLTADEPASLRAALGALRSKAQHAGIMVIEQVGGDADE